MRLLAIGFVALVLVVILLAILFRRERAQRAWRFAEAHAQWVSGHYSRGNETYVVVRKVARLPSGAERELETLSVATVHSIDPDWQDKFTAAKRTAFERATELNLML